ncbi:MAG: hypothetical protein ACP5SD_03270 [Elusimicrobiales bacterium]
MRYIKIIGFALKISIVSMLYIISISKEINSENITITTYYPAPYGGYVTILTTSNTYLARDGGAVGIGTQNPQAKLEVNGTFRLTPIFYDPTPKPGLMFYHSPSSTLWLSTGTNNYSWVRVAPQTPSIPQGMIAAFYLSSCPDGWVLANGTNSTPDLRGVFIRGLDMGRGFDSGRTLGSLQQDAFQGHKHELFDGRYPPGGTIGQFVWVGDIGGREAVTGKAISDDINGTPRTASETRPKNVALIYCMKI